MAFVYSSYELWTIEEEAISCDYSIESGKQGTSYANGGNRLLSQSLNLAKVRDM